MKQFYKILTEAVNIDWDKKFKSPKQKKMLFEFLSMINQHVKAKNPKNKNIMMKWFVKNFPEYSKYKVGYRALTLSPKDFQNFLDMGKITLKKKSSFVSWASKLVDKTVKVMINISSNTSNIKPNKNGKIGGIIYKSENLIGISLQVLKGLIKRDYMTIIRIIEPEYPYILTVIEELVDALDRYRNEREILAENLEDVLNIDKEIVKIFAYSAKRGGRSQVIFDGNNSGLSNANRYFRKKEDE